MTKKLPTREEEFVTVNPEDFKDMQYEVKVQVEPPANCIYKNPDCPVCPRQKP